MNELELIGAQIKAIRQSEGLSVRDLASKVGITYQSLNRIENGRYNTGISNIYRILDALKCEIVIKKKA
jgi:transcriptional regulator with XRE-family HTH domain